MSDLINHAKNEMDIAWPEECEMQALVRENILELVEVFSKQGHTGMSAPYVLAHFQKLANFETITPLTGEESEWVEVGENLFQNKRDGEVFKKGYNGQAYWISGNVFRDQNGSTFTCSKSRVAISFPWTKPQSNIVDVFEE